MSETETGANLEAGGQGEGVEGRELGPEQCGDELEAARRAVETADPGARERGLQDPLPAILRASTRQSSGMNEQQQPGRRVFPKTIVYDRHRSAEERVDRQSGGCGEQLFTSCASWLLRGVQSLGLGRRDGVGLASAAGA